MKRRLANLAACGVLALAAAACTSGNGASTGPAHHPPAHRSRAAERPQRASLMLPAGRSSARYVITAPSPARYVFDVSVSAPGSANVSINALTWYGATLWLLPSTGDRDMCQRRDSRDVCLEHFPFLPAQRAGRWTIVASKRSGPAATVDVAITFGRP